MTNPEANTPNTHSPERIVGLPINFRTTSEITNDTRKITIEVTEVLEHLGFGHFSEWVAEVKAATVAEDGSLSPEHVFVMKKFDVPDDYPKDFPLPAIKAMENYELLRKSGLKTWDTYRISYDNEMILMTSGNVDDKTLVSTANDSASRSGAELLKTKIQEITNFETFLEELSREIRKASEAGIYIQTDTYGFFLDNKSADTNKSSLDFVFADLDNLWIDTDPNLFKNNVEQLRFTVETLIELYVAPESQENYREILNAHIKNLIGEIA